MLHLLLHHLALHHLLPPLLLLLLLVLRGLEALIRVVSRRGALLELHCRGPHRVLLALPLQLWLHFLTWCVVPAAPVLVVAFALRRELILQPRRRHQLASSGRLRVGRGRRRHLDA